MNGLLAFILPAAPALVVLAGALVMVGRLHAARRASVGFILRRDAHGDLVVPVLGLFTGAARHGLRGGAKNSLGPVLAITPDGLRFKVLREARWSFSEIAQVDLGRALVSPSLQFKSARRGVLVADVASLGLARQVLMALPPSVPLTPKAMALRDGPVPGRLA